MISSDQTLRDAVLRSMERALLGDGQASEFTDGTSVRDLIADELATEFTSGERTTLRSMDEVGGRALALARAGQFELADGQYRNAASMLNDRELNPAARSLAESVLAAQRAYRAHRSGDDATARTLLELAVRRDLELEARHGYAVLRIHRMQLLGNVLRIYANRGVWKMALAIGVSVLAYLERFDERVLRNLPDPWGQCWEGRVPALERRAGPIHARLSRQTIRTLTTTGVSFSADEFGAVLEAVGLNDPTTQVSNWCEFQAAHFRRRTDDRLSAAIVSLDRGPVPSAPLWRQIVEWALTFLGLG